MRRPRRISHGQDARATLPMRFLSFFKHSTKNVIRLLGIPLRFTSFTCDLLYRKYLLQSFLKILVALNPALRKMHGN
jgi:hypothetical protein